jgi:hypothetical protein
LYELRRWYQQECEKQGQEEWGTRPCYYDTFQDGTRITRGQRRLYRSRADLQLRFPDPYQTGRQEDSFLRWFRDYGPEEVVEASLMQGELDAVKSELERIKRSRIWRLRSRLIGLRPSRRA